MSKYINKSNHESIIAKSVISLIIIKNIIKSVISVLSVILLNLISISTNIDTINQSVI